MFTLIFLCEALGILWKVFKASIWIAGVVALIYIVWAVIKHIRCRNEGGSS